MRSSTISCNRDYKKLEESLEDITTPITISIIGCVVNGPGESKAANIGISLPGTGEAPNCPILIDGQHTTTLRGSCEELSEAFRKLIDNYIEKTYEKNLS